MDIPRKRRDLFQNIAISLLSVSAVLLFAQTQLYNLSSGGGYWARLMGNSAATAVAGSSQETVGLSAPVRVAVSGDYGRYGNLCLSTSDDAFVPLSTLLGEALGSSRDLVPCGEAEFRAALSRVSVYYDFLQPLPLSILGELAGETLPEEPISARRLVVASEEDVIRLFLWDGTDHYFACDTAVTQTGFSDLVSRYELGYAYFAFDNLDADPHYGDIAPYSLFLSPLPTLPVLSASNPLEDTSSLLSALDFNPNTNSRYTDSAGTEVIREDDRSLRIQSDGTIRYQGGSTPGLEIKSQDTLPTLSESAAGGAALLNRLLNGRSGDGSLYLLDIQRQDQRTVLRFGYQAGGVPICFSDGSAAAELTLSGTSVTALTLRFRQYAATEESSPLLPLRQALAIAAEHPGSELSIGYADNGGDTVSAGWLAS